MPLWAGPGVTGRGEYETGSLAREGARLQPEVEISNEGLEALLDALG